MSPTPKVPSPLSVTVPSLVTSIEGLGVISTTVGSLVVFPSPSLPLSDTSVTSPLLPGVLAIPVAVLLILGVFSAAALMV